MFGYSIIKTEKLERLKAIEERAYMAHRWLSGFKDLDIIWDWIFGKSRHSYTDAMRSEYAKIRNTTEYGKPLDLVRLESAEKVVNLLNGSKLHLAETYEAQREAERYKKVYLTNDKN